MESEVRYQKAVSAYIGIVGKQVSNDSLREAELFLAFIDGYLEKPAVDLKLNLDDKRKQMFELGHQIAIIESTNGRKKLELILH
ncbi:MAG TPA: hypothetical protein VJJ52_00015 [Candidatus Nanoarchaeia archaeon]|nr:hypothetical protein [Candidatus Nanoarchaeia archaeon]